MQIVAKKRLQFTDYEISINPRNNETVAKVVRTFVVSPSTRLQQVPDWIVNDDLLELAIGDGSVIAIGVIPEKEPKPVVQEPSRSLAQPKQPATELTEGDLELLNRPISELIRQTPQQSNYPTTSNGWPSTKST